MKRTIITILAMLPTVLLATPAIVGAVDVVAWILLGGAVIGQWDEIRAVVAIGMGMVAFPLCMVTLCALEEAA